MNSVVTLTAALACGVVFSASAESVLKLEIPSSMLLFEQKDVAGAPRLFLRHLGAKVSDAESALRLAWNGESNDPTRRKGLRLGGVRVLRGMTCSERGACPCR